MKNMVKLNASQEREGGLQEGRTGVLGWEILYDHYVKLGFKHDKEIKVSQKSLSKVASLSQVSPQCHH